MASSWVASLAALMHCSKVVAVPSSLGDPEMKERPFMRCSRLLALAGMWWLGAGGLGGCASGRNTVTGRITPEYLGLRYVEWAAARTREAVRMGWSRERATGSESLREFEP